MYGHTNNITYYLLNTVISIYIDIPLSRLTIYKRPKIAHIHTYIYICIYIYTYTLTRPILSSHVNMYMHMYIHIHIYI